MGSGNAIVEFKFTSVAADDLGIHEGVGTQTSDGVTPYEFEVAYPDGMRIDLRNYKSGPALSYNGNFQDGQISVDSVNDYEVLMFNNGTIYETQNVHFMKMVPTSSGNYDLFL